MNNDRIIKPWEKVLSSVRDAYEDASNTDIACGKALHPDKECPECGRDMIYNHDKSRYDCTGIKD